MGQRLIAPSLPGPGEKKSWGLPKQVASAAKEFQPELVLISAGFDSRFGDPLGEFTLSDDDFGELTAIMLEIADMHAGGRLVSVLEGGYN